MRPILTVLAALTFSGVASAQAAPPAQGLLTGAYAPLRAVGIMHDTKQVLLWDEDLREYRLGRIGDLLYGWKIVALATDKVVLGQGTVQDELWLVTAPTWLRPTHPQPGARHLPAVIVVASEPSPPDPTAPPTPSTTAPTTAPPTPPTTATPAPREERRTLSRSAWERDLRSLDQIFATVKVAPVPGTGFLLQSLPKDSWVFTMGLREGDVVSSIADQRVLTVEDAGQVYARLFALSTFTLEVTRDGQPLSLIYSVTKN